MKDVDSKTLTQIFQKLGAKNPERWAESQIEEGIPQLARYIFLRESWNLIVSNNQWISESKNVKSDDSPGSDVGNIIERIMSSGIDANDLTRLVRIKQWELLSGICRLLDDPGELEEEINNISWALYLLNDEGNPVVPISGLYESVLETDPSGNEMKPVLDQD